MKNCVFQIQYPRVSLHDIYRQLSEDEDSITEDTFYRSDSLHNRLTTTNDESEEVESGDIGSDNTVVQTDPLRTCQSLDRYMQNDNKQQKQRQFSDSYFVLNNFKQGNHILTS